MNDEKNFIGLMKVMKQQWEELKVDLYSGKTEGMTIDEMISNYTFVNRFDQVVENLRPLLDRNLSRLGPMYRGTGLNKEIALNDYSRMIPSVAYATQHNRMNPPGKAFIYLGIMPEREYKSAEEIKKEVTKTVSAELRAEKNDYFTMCQFSPVKDVKVINILGDDKLPENFNEFALHLFKNQNELAINLANYYFNLFNHDEIFKPVHSNVEITREREYAPFQFLAKYIQYKGYEGMMYRSTVSKKGTNLVLFNVTDVKVNESSMEKVSI